MSLHDRLTEKVDVAGVYVQNTKTGKKLLIKRRDGRWDITKGKVDPGEKPKTAAKRETGEESGIRPSVSDQFVDVKNKKNKKKIRVYKGTTDKNSVKLQPSEHTKFKWSTDDEAIEKLRKTPHLAKAVAKLRGRA
jgi:8-oxo-dGTP pyrophosphatase MutT (NUDIX family)